MTDTYREYVDTKAHKLRLLYALSGTEPGYAATRSTKEERKDASDKAAVAVCLLASYRLDMACAAAAAAFKGEKEGEKKEEGEKEAEGEKK
eukprot:690659-Rhodomonas_salina.1